MNKIQNLKKIIKLIYNKNHNNNYYLYNNKWKESLFQINYNNKSNIKNNHKVYSKNNLMNKLKVLIVVAKIV